MISIYINNYFSAFFVYMVDIIAGQLIATPDLKKKRKGFGWRLTLGILIDLASTIIGFLIVGYVGWDMWENLLVYFLMLISALFAYWLIMDYKLSNIVLITTISAVLQHISYKLIYLLYETWLQGVVWQNLGNWGYFFFYYLIRLTIDSAVIICFYFFAGKKYKENFSYTIKNVKTLTYLTITIISSIVLNTIFIYKGSWLRGASIIVALLSILIGLLTIYIISGDMSLVKAQSEYMALQATYEEKIKQYELTKKQEDLINIKAHDLKKLINYLDSQDEISAEQKDEVKNLISDYDISVNTGNAPLDNLLTRKKNDTQVMGISINCMVDGQALNSIKPGDVFALFSNMIDNAIEAVKNVEDKDKRIISLVVKSEKGFITIEETNYYAGNIYFDKGLPKTSKDDPDYHGFGTKSIKYISEMLGGKVIFSTNDDIFTVNVVLPNKN